MRLHLDRDRLEPLLWEETVEVSSDLDLTDLARAIGPVHCLGRLDVVEGGFLLHMDLTALLELSCSRCLCDLEEPLTSAIDVVLHLAGEHPAPADEVELEEEDLDVLRVEGDTLDTTAIVAEQILLEVPMKPLCRPDCAGLCPQCGADRNETPNCCDARPVDSRWAVLAGMRERLHETERG